MNINSQSLIGSWERIQENGVIKQSALDHALSNNLPNIISHKKIHNTFSDHAAIVIDIAARKQKNKKMVINFMHLDKTIYRTVFDDFCAVQNRRHRTTALPDEFPHRRF